MTKSSRQAAIAGYLKRDDGVDWKGLTDYANSMYDVRDELEIADVEDNFDTGDSSKGNQEQNSVPDAAPASNYSYRIQKGSSEASRRFY